METPATTTLSVFPSNIGEYATYTFTTVLNDPTEQGLALDAKQEIRIFFDVDLYDFYVGDVDLRYPGQKDEDGFEMYYLPCLVSIGEQGPLSKATCTSKRHVVRVKLGVEVAD